MNKRSCHILQSFISLASQQEFLGDEINKNTKTMMMPQSVLLVAWGGAFLFISLFIFFSTSDLSALVLNTVFHFPFFLSPSSLLQLHSPLSPPAPGFDNHLLADKEVKCGNRAALPYYISIPKTAVFTPRTAAAAKRQLPLTRDICTEKKEETPVRVESRHSGSRAFRKQERREVVWEEPVGFFPLSQFALAQSSLSRRWLHLAWKLPRIHRIRLS